MAVYIEVELEVIMVKRLNWKFKVNLVQLMTEVSVDLPKMKSVVDFIKV